jgi:hypothetical protein
MTTEYVQILGSTSTNVTVTSTSLTSVFLQEITGGSLDVQNRLRYQGQYEISFGGQDDFCTLYLYYAGLTVSNCEVKNSAAGARANKGLLIEAELSADGSINSQFGTIHSYLGLPRSEDGSTPIGFGSLGVASGGDEDFEIRVQWDSGGNSITHNHSTLELLSYVEDVPLDDLDDPTAYIFLNSRLNRLRYDLRKDAYFYAPLEYELDFYGYGEVTFVRGSTSTATYADGVSHAVAAHEPRFEYSGSTVLGLAINTGTETLTFATTNLLSDSNTICWLENGVFKSTPTNTNPFNGSGVWTGVNGSHITHIVKFNRVLTTSEKSEVENAIT